MTPEQKQFSKDAIEYIRHSRTRIEGLPITLLEGSGFDRPTVMEFLNRAEKVFNALESAWSSLDAVTRERDMARKQTEEWKHKYAMTDWDLGVVRYDNQIRSTVESGLRKEISKLHAEIARLKAAANPEVI